MRCSTLLPGITPHENEIIFNPIKFYMKGIKSSIQCLWNLLDGHEKVQTVSFKKKEIPIKCEVKEP